MLLLLILLRTFTDPLDRSLVLFMSIIKLFVQGTIIRENFPGFDGGKLTNTRAARPLKNILFNLIELGDNVDGLNSYVTARYDYNDF